MKLFNFVRIIRVTTVAPDRRSPTVDSSNLQHLWEVSAKIHVVFTSLHAKRTKKFLRVQVALKLGWHFISDENDSPTLALT